MKIVTLLSIALATTTITLSDTLLAVSKTDAPAAMTLADKHEKDARSDTAITTDIKAKFIKEKLFGDEDISAMRIHVKTQNGTVHLTGTADNQEQIDNAISLSKSVDGVKNVDNSIKLKEKK